MDKRFLAIVGIIIIAFVGFLLLRGDSAEAPKSNAKPSSHVKGEGASGVTLVEYGDFQCPACLQYFPAVEEVVEKYKDDIKFQFRHFPLVSIHPNAFAASRAAEAASKQGKFWEMYRKLYENQNAWSGSSKVTAIFDSYAKELGLDVQKFQEDFKSTLVNDTIQADIKAGEKIDAKSTPTFVLNGTKIENPSPTADAFSKVIDEAIAKKKNSQKENQ